MDIQFIEDKEYLKFIKSLKIAGRGIYGRKR